MVYHFGCTTWMLKNWLALNEFALGCANSGFSAPAKKTPARALYICHTYLSYICIVYISLKHNQTFVIVILLQPELVNDISTRPGKKTSALRQVCGLPMYRPNSRDF